MTLDDICAEFAVSRRTAERLRDAVEAAFGPLEMVDVGDKRRHWRLQSAVLRPLLRVSREELAEIGSAAKWLDRAGLTERAGALREITGKLRALRRPPLHYGVRLRPGAGHADRRTRHAPRSQAET